MNEHGFYIIKDEFFEIINDKYLKINKGGNRPHYYCLAYKDFYWMIPLSSKVDKYKEIINKRQKTNKSCDMLHIAKLDDGKENVFLIQDIFPITEKFIEREFIKFDKQFMVTSQSLIAILEKKAKRIINISLSGKKILSTQIDIKAITAKLVEYKRP